MEIHSETRMVSGQNEIVKKQHFFSARTNVAIDCSFKKMHKEASVFSSSYALS